MAQAGAGFYRTIPRATIAMLQILADLPVYFGFEYGVDNGRGRSPVFNGPLGSGNRACG
jgi:hypothetical protein